MAERLQSGATVKAVYGDPVTTGDRTVIPVARVKFGFGAGGGKRSHDEGGGGGGGGMRADPAGMIEISPAGTTFKAFPDYRRLATAFAVGILVGKLLSRGRRNPAANPMKRPENRAGKNSYDCPRITPGSPTPIVTRGIWRE